MRVNALESRYHNKKVVKIKENGNAAAPTEANTLVAFQKNLNAKKNLSNPKIIIASLITTITAFLKKQTSNLVHLFLDENDDNDRLKYDTEENELYLTDMYNPPFIDYYYETNPTYNFPNKKWD